MIWYSLCSTLIQSLISPQIRPGASISNSLGSWQLKWQLSNIRKLWPISKTLGDIKGTLQHKTQKSCYFSQLCHIIRLFKFLSLNKKHNPVEVGMHRKELSRRSFSRCNTSSIAITSTEQHSASKGSQVRVLCRSRERNGPGAAAEQIRHPVSKFLESISCEFVLIDQNMQMHRLVGSLDIK